MPPSHDKMIDASHLDAFASLANTTLDGTERLLSLNLQAARSLLCDALTHSKALSEASDLNEVLSLNAALSQPFWRRRSGIGAAATKSPLIRRNNWSPPATPNSPISANR
ncbi:MAG: phasin family protein [Candidatus Accumulibacter sp.]|nr:phasin family protein [Candidatus Accumulibacter propinquus]